MQAEQLGHQRKRVTGLQRFAFFCDLLLRIRSESILPVHAITFAQIKQCAARGCDNQIGWTSIHVSVDYSAMRLRHSSMLANEIARCHTLDLEARLTEIAMQCSARYLYL